MAMTVAFLESMNLTNDDFPQCLHAMKIPPTQRSARNKLRGNAKKDKAINVILSYKIRKFLHTHNTEDDFTTYFISY